MSAQLLICKFAVNFTCVSFFLRMPRVTRMARSLSRPFVHVCRELSLMVIYHNIHLTLVKVSPVVMNVTIRSYSL